MSEATQSSPDQSNGQSDDPSAWVDQYGDDLYAFALARVNQPDIAEDLVQETFLAALRSRKNFEKRSSVRTWLISILKHKIVDHYRKKGREKKVSLIDDFEGSVDALFDETGEWNREPRTWSFNPLKAVEQKEFMDIFYNCIAALPKRMARAFMLREVDGVSTEALCEELGITPNNSWVLLYRARMSLRDCIEQNWLGAA